MKAAKGEWTDEQCKITEKGMTSENSKEACNILKALTKAQQHPDGEHICSKQVN